MKTISHITVTPKGIVLNGEKVKISDNSLNAIYRELIGDYPKFFKMDGLCKLGFISAELLLKDMDAREKESAAIILFNRSGSLVTDRKYQETIATNESFFPSPSLFVYTLANIVTGEIAIRHKIYGESSFYVMEREDWTRIKAIAEGCFATSFPSVILTGWVEYGDENSFTANLKIFANEK